MEHIIYLGGLGSTEDPLLSQHLRSRHEVAEILQSGPVPATFLRAAMILGSGSASFEILRYLVDRLPVMITPRWVHNPVQPIAIRNVLNYLQGCLEHEETRGQTFDIGGPEVVDLPAIIRHLCRRSPSSAPSHHPGAGPDAHLELLLDPSGHPGPGEHRQAPGRGAEQPGSL